MKNIYHLALQFTQWVNFDKRSSSKRSIALLFTFLPFTLIAQVYDLTGYWQSDAGGCYQIRQMGNEVLWTGEPSGSVRSQNVFHGAIAGNTLTGLWYDLPSNPARAFGASLSTRIENNTRMVKTYESVSYRGSVWTKKSEPCSGNIPSTPPSSTGSSHTLSGQWDLKCCNNSLSWTLTISKQDGNTFSGFLSDDAGGGEISNGLVRNNNIEFDRSGGWGRQHWVGQLINENGRLRMINGVWTGDYLNRYIGQNNWHAEKKN